MIDTLERPAAKLSHVPSGHWRCKWTRVLVLPGDRFIFSIKDVAQNLPGTIVIDDDTWISPPRFLTRERADQDGLKWTTSHIRYVDAVYFPGEAP